MDMGGWGEGEGEANGESSVEAYTPPYIRQIDNGNLLCELRELRPGLCNHREGWGKDGKWEVTQEGRDICTPMANSC